MKKKIDNVITLYDNYDAFYDSQVYCIEIGAEENPDSFLHDYAKECEKTSPFVMCVDIAGHCYFNINHKYFEQNYKECNEMIKRILSKTQYDLIGILPNLYLNEEFISIIKRNEHIKEYMYSFGTLDKEDLSLELVKFLDEPSERINIGLFVKKSYNYNSSIELNEIYNENDLKKLKTLFQKFPQRIVIISGNALSQLDDLLPLIDSEKIIINDERMYVTANRHRHVGKGHIKYDNYDPNNYTKECIENDNAMDAILETYEKVIEDYNNVYFHYNPSNYISSPCLRNKDKVLNNIVDDIKLLKLTPAEAYMFIFYITKMFKSYKESDETNYEESRNTYFTLFNEYIVCAGYCDLACELIKKYNDPNLRSVIYECRGGTHARIMVDVNDKKYKVKGLYASEITWDDVSFNETLYKYFLLTKDQLDTIDSENILDCTFYMMDGSSNKGNYTRTNDYDLKKAWEAAQLAYWKLYALRHYKFGEYKLADEPLISASPVSNDTIDTIKFRLFNKLYVKKENNEFLKKMKLLYYYLWGYRKSFENYISSHVDMVDIDETKRKV